MNTLLIKKKINEAHSKISYTMSEMLSNMFPFLGDDNPFTSKGYYEIMNHPEDKKAFEDAVDYLKKNRDVKYRDVKLHNRTITITIDNT